MKNDKILVVIDAQNDFITGSLGSPAAVAVIPNICKKIANFEGKVITTRDTHYDTYLNTQEGRNLPIIHCQKDTWGYDIEQSVSDALLDKEIIHNITKSTFGTTRLSETINWAAGRTLQEIIIIGLVTDICIITNALLLKTAFPEITITVDASCCAGTTPENHAAALQVMRSCQINVVNDIPAKKQQISPTSCKFGYKGCVRDPGYIWETDPKWYTKLYGDIPYSEVDCSECINGEGYDDEDK